MHIRKFSGTTAKDAMNAVKAEFGEQALIFSTRRISNGLYEVTAALDYDAVEPAGGLMRNAVGARAYAGAQGDCQRIDPLEDHGELIKRELDEIRGLKDICKAIISQVKGPDYEPYVHLEAELVTNGIDRRLAQKMVESAVKGVGQKKAKDSAYIRRFMRERVAGKLAVSDPLESRSVLAFVGPTGVGKTTTIAKLAAVHALRKKKSVALLTMDTYRIAAAEQLKVYGSIIGVSVDVASSATELYEQISRHSDKDLVLIDTAGRNHRDRGQMKELSSLARTNPDVKFNLVLSAQTRDDVLYDSVKGYADVPVGSLTFTKLDETGVYGPILNTMILANMPVAYLSSGQRVPDDIELATTERLSEFFLPN